MYMYMYIHVYMCIVNEATDHSVSEGVSEILAVGGDENRETVDQVHLRELQGC